MVTDFEQTRARLAAGRHQLLNTFFRVALQQDRSLSVTQLEHQRVVVLGRWPAVQSNGGAKTSTPAPPKSKRAPSRNSFTSTPCLRASSSRVASSWLWGWTLSHNSRGWKLAITARIPRRGRSARG